MTRAFTLHVDSPAAAWLGRDAVGIWYGNGEAPQWARDGLRVRVCGVTRDGRVYRSGRLVADDADCGCCTSWSVRLGAVYAGER